LLSIYEVHSLLSFLPRNRPGKLKNSKFQRLEFWVPASTDLFNKQAAGCLLVGCGLQTMKPVGPDALIK